MTIAAERSLAGHWTLGAIVALLLGCSIGNAETSNRELREAGAEASRKCAVRRSALPYVGTAEIDACRHALIIAARVWKPDGPESAMARFNLGLALVATADPTQASEGLRQIAEARSTLCGHDATSNECKHAQSFLDQMKDVSAIRGGAIEAPPNSGLTANQCVRLYDQLLNLSRQAAAHGARPDDPRFTKVFNEVVASHPECEQVLQAYELNER